MTIVETGICQWADHHECRSNLPILVRRLIRETTSSLVSIRFPGNEAVDLSGPDGRVECEAATTWVSAGKSVWEMGCTRDARTKANADYAKRTEEIPQLDFVQKLLTSTSRKFRLWRFHPVLHQGIK